MRLVAGEGLANELSVYVDGKQVEFCIFADNLLGIALCVELPPLPFESRKYVVLQGRVEFRDQQGNPVADYPRRHYGLENLEIIELGGTTPPVYSQDEVKELHVEVLRKMDVIRKSATLIAPEEEVSWHFPQVLDPVYYPTVSMEPQGKIEPVRVALPCLFCQEPVPSGVGHQCIWQEGVPYPFHFDCYTEYGSVLECVHSLSQFVHDTTIIGPLQGLATITRVRDTMAIRKRGTLPELWNTESTPGMPDVPFAPPQSVLEAGTTPCHYCQQPISPQDEQGAEEVADTWIYFHRRCKL